MVLNLSSIFGPKIVIAIYLVLKIPQNQCQPVRQRILFSSKSAEPKKPHTIYQGASFSRTEVRALFDEAFPDAAENETRRALRRTMTERVPTAVEDYYAF